MLIQCLVAFFILQTNLIIKYSGFTGIGAKVKQDEMNFSRAPAWKQFQVNFIMMKLFTEMLRYS